MVGLIGPQAPALLQQGHGERPLFKLQSRGERGSSQVIESISRFFPCHLVLSDNSAPTPKRSLTPCKISDLQHLQGARHNSGS